ncbi:sulfotransferase family 2 domain-containing protein [Burkholderia sp. WSM2230]|uniref:sulfotransferase family 2 domain-containing protein n=1 Tax=Burkholderia sp. WSM2230 TaxID=944435 RepID=UPI00046F9864|nr:sulfotransferase family 2 domain-containing protein [Burkholderia sp. WSM2230]
MSAPTFFIHPPKSGGSTVISFFDLNKGKDQFVVFEWDREGWDNCRNRLLETHIGGGHQSYGIHRSLKTPLAYCTVLRDPLARHISHYRYALNGKNGEVARGASVSATEALVLRGTLSLDEWVSESLGGRNIFVQMLSGHSAPDELSLGIAKANLQHYFSTVGICENMSEFLLRLCAKTGLKLPFYFKTNITSGSSEQIGQLSESAKQKFIDDNRLDYELFEHVRREIRNDAHRSAGVFAKALELVEKIQTEINRLENPYLHRSVVFGFDEAFLAKVHGVIGRFDLAPIDEYLRFAQTETQTLADMYDGFVDAVRDGVVSGWAVNLSRPEQKVLLEVRVGSEVIARGSSGEPRPDVANAGYPSAYAGFSIALPPGAPDGFHVALADSAEQLHNAGVWRQGWHCV